MSRPTRRWRPLLAGQFALITLDPGHFHAALVQKYMYADVDPLVHVYAPAGEDLTSHLERVSGFNARDMERTHWREQVYTGPDFLQRMLADKAGNVVVISGNNAHKTDYILRSVQAGLNVLADKPMVIVPADLTRLRQAFTAADAQGVLLCDIMTERFEITSILQRELSQQPDLFGALQRGSPSEPAIRSESIHRRAAVTTASQFRGVTGAARFPEFLRSDVHGNELDVLTNGDFNYRLRGINAYVRAEWKFEAPAGSGDAYYSLMRGTRANLIIRQGAEQQYKPVLYIDKAAGVDAAVHDAAVETAIASLQDKYPGVGMRREGESWAVTIPARYNVDHEAHFAQVTQNFLGYLRAGRLPSWEVPNMLTKYSTIMQAVQLSRPVGSAGGWQRDDTSLAWRVDGRTLWRFSFDSRQGKPFFNPLAAGAASLTTFQPEDHPWHYGLWFSWKYINGANYWEENRTSGKAEGATRWSMPLIDTRPDGSAVLHLDMSYVHPSGRIDLTESRGIEISAPAHDGSYTIDWVGRFTAGAQGAVLDRTPMPGEPDGRVNGGYAGLGVRLAAAPAVMSVVTPEGPVTKFDSDRARPASSAVAAGFVANGREIGSIAILSDPHNSGERAPWYVVNASAGMRFMCAAVLAPQVRKLAPGAEMTLRYRILVRPAPWTPAELGAAVKAWAAGGLK